MPLPADPLEAWARCGESVGGLVADFVAMAASAAWEGEVLHVVFPPEAGQAVRMLSAPQTVGKLDAALTQIAGRPVRQRISLAPKPAVRAPVPVPVPVAAPERPRSDGPADDPTPGDRHDGPRADAPAAAPAPARSQVALVRETMDHPLVAHARGLLDAAIRKVEQGRPRPVPAAVPAEGAAVAENAATGGSEVD